MSRIKATLRVIGEQQILPFDREESKAVLDRRQEQELIAALAELLVEAARREEGGGANDE